MTKDGMRVGIAADHGGYELKQDLARRLSIAGYKVVDFGAVALNPDDDYPDFVIPLAETVATGRVDRGVAICGSGVGASVCANKIRGVRAALIHDHFSARQGVEDDHINIICLGGPYRRAGRRLGSRADIPGSRFQSGGTTPAPARESHCPGTLRRNT
jgi:ribose 5-phosphate isomerase B